jgi:hypothetical protein
MSMIMIMWQLTPAPTRSVRPRGRLSKPTGSYGRMLHTEHLTLKPLQKTSIEELDTIWLRAKPAQGSHLRRGHAERHLRNGWTNEGTAFLSLVRRRHHVYKHHEHVLDACCAAQVEEQAWRAAVPTNSQELVTRSSAAMLSVICATDRQTKGLPPTRLFAVATTSTSTTCTYLTRAAALRPWNKHGEQQFRRTAKRSLLVGHGHTVTERRWCNGWTNEGPSTRLFAVATTFTSTTCTY